MIEFKFNKELNKFQIIETQILFEFTPEHLEIIKKLAEEEKNDG